MNRLGFTANVLGNQMAVATYGASVIKGSLPVISVVTTSAPSAGNYLVTNDGTYFVDQSANKLIFV
jgi:hypothetical protein